MPRETEGVNEREGGQGEREEGRDEGARAGIKGRDGRVPNALPVFYFLSSLHGEGQRWGSAAVLTQVRASHPGTASHFDLLCNKLAERKIHPTVRNT